MVTGTNEQVTAATPSELGLNAQGLTYEQSIAYYIVGKLVLDGALDPRNFNFNSDVEGIPFIVDSIAESISAGLEAFGWQHGVSAVIDAAQVGETRGWEPRAKQGGAK